MIELLVVSGIFVLITGLILVNNNRFGGVILLENLAYDIALSIRQAQVYGISVRQYGTGGFSAGYGMHFQVSSPTSYVLFADAVSQNGLYDGCPDVGSCELVESRDIGRGYAIMGLCSPAGADPETCTAVSSIDVLFKRPEPDACISSNGAPAVNDNYVCTGGRESARITLESPRGDRRSVIVEVSGQIATE